MEGPSLEYPRHPDTRTADLRAREVRNLDGTITIASVLQKARRELLLVVPFRGHVHAEHRQLISGQVARDRD